MTSQKIGSTRLLELGLELIARLWTLEPPDYIRPIGTSLVDKTLEQPLRVLYGRRSMGDAWAPDFPGRHVYVGRAGDLVAVIIEASGGLEPDERPTSEDRLRRLACRRAALPESTAAGRFRWHAGYGQNERTQAADRLKRLLREPVRSHRHCA